MCLFQCTLKHLTIPEKYSSCISKKQQYQPTQLWFIEVILKWVVEKLLCLNYKGKGIFRIQYKHWEELEECLPLTTWKSNFYHSVFLSSAPFALNSWALSLKILASFDNSWEKVEAKLFGKNLHYSSLYHI